MDKTIGSYISDWFYKIEKRYRVCFFSAIICGLMAHIYALTNHLYNYDELWHTPTGFGTGTEVGRWALSATVYIQKIFFADVFTIPMINGLITIVLYTIAACFVVSVFDIHDEFYAGLTGALMITFPALVCRMFFMFTTHYYAIGIALVALGVWLVTKKKHTVVNIIIAIACLTYGMAIYQANFVTGVCMMVGYLLQRFIREDVELKTAIRNCVNCVLYLGLCMIAFLVGSKVALKITGKQMETYENLDTMGQLSLNQLVEGLIRCYKTFFKMPIKNVYAMNPNSIVKLAFLVGIFVLLYTLVKVWKSKKMLHIKILISLIIAVIPVAVNLIIVMAISSGTMYSIMVYELVFMLIIPMACLEALGKTEIEEAKKAKTQFAVNIVTALVLSATVVTYIWFANGNYLAMEYTNVHDNAYYTVLMSQIKSVEGYSDEMPLVLIGKPEHDKTNSRRDMIGKTFNLSGKNDTNVAVYSSWNIMTRVLGFDPVIKDSDEDEAYYRGLDEVKDMPIYPSSGSMKVIDDTLVIKFQEVDELD